MASQRIRYTEWQKSQVRDLYPGCRTNEDRLELAERAQILDEEGKPSISRLYNLANRLGVTGRKAPLTDATTPRLEGPGKSEFTPAFDKYLSQEFGRNRLDRIAFQHGYSEPAAAYHAIELGLRRPASYWDLDKAAAFLGLEADTLKESVPSHVLPDRRGHAAITLVSTESLLRYLEQPEAGADIFFLKELELAKQTLDSGEALGPIWLSHERTCLNPYAMGFGLFMGEEDEKTPVLSLTVEDLAEMGAERWGLAPAPLGSF